MFSCAMRVEEQHDASHLVRFRWGGEGDSVRAEDYEP